MPRWFPAFVLLAAVLLLPAPAAAHDASTTARAEVTGTGVNVRVVLDLEYDLLMKSAWLYATAYEAEERAEQLRQLKLNRDAVVQYVTERFAVAYDERPCAPALTGDADVRPREKKSYAVLTFAFACQGEPGGAHAISSALFPDAETFVHSTETVVRYDLDGERGSAVLVAESPTLKLGGRVEPAGTGAFLLIGGLIVLVAGLYPLHRLLRR
ncbi:hypothetical protein [Nonomuraea gerenzanensis]|uniref:Secreted protein n=1 Tax=Nonomuraea gerenzanensis TaxID=93944 RepID=A0A1M4ELN9_9ACTN|nr:hypothetical protein [Nonomuraea gerenzanensis]UBU11282.1 hypothetical protein LCN96_44355 [Nonomuraea gerenzanensis]SBO99757.1 hypothetical protein BN4615_P9273 [Nonomuraea gerenzanensis]